MLPPSKIIELCSASSGEEIAPNNDFSGASRLLALSVSNLLQIPNLETSDFNDFYSTINTIQTQIKNHDSREITDDGIKIRLYENNLELSRVHVLLQAVDMYRGAFLLYQQTVNNPNLNEEDKKLAQQLFFESSQRLMFLINSSQNPDAFDNAIKDFNEPIIAISAAFLSSKNPKRKISLEEDAKDIDPEEAIKTALFTRNLAMLQHGGEPEIIVTRKALTKGNTLWEVSEERSYPGVIIQPKLDSFSKESKLLGANSAKNARGPAWVQQVRENYGEWAVDMLGEISPIRSPQTDFRILPNPANSFQNNVFLENQDGTVIPLVADARSSTPTPKDVKDKAARKAMTEENVTALISETAFKAGAQKFVDDWGGLLTAAQITGAPIALPWVYQSLLSPSISDKTGLVDAEGPLLARKRDAVKNHKDTVEGYNTIVIDDKKNTAFTFTAQLFDTNHPFTRLGTIEKTSLLNKALSKIGGSVGEDAHYTDDHAALCAAVGNTLALLYTAVNEVRKSNTNPQQRSPIPFPQDIRKLDVKQANAFARLLREEAEKHPEHKAAYFQLAMLTQALAYYQEYGTKLTSGYPSEIAHTEIMLAACERLFGNLGLPTEGGCKSSADRLVDATTMAEAIAIQTYGNDEWKMTSPVEYYSKASYELKDIQSDIIKSGHHQHVLARNGIPPARNTGESNANNALGGERICKLRKEGTFAYKSKMLREEADLGELKKEITTALNQYLADQRAKETSLMEKKESSSRSMLTSWNSTDEQLERVRFKIAVLEHTIKRIENAQHSQQIINAVQPLKDVNHDRDINVGDDVIVKMKFSKDLNMINNGIDADITSFQKKHPEDADSSDDDEIDKTTSRVKISG
jgi:hypothetical protein